MLSMSYRLFTPIEAKWILQTLEEVEYLDGYAGKEKRSGPVVSNLQSFDSTELNDSTDLGGD